MARRLSGLQSRLHDGGKCLRHALHVTVIQPGHAHATAGDQVYTELIAQTISPGCAKPGIAEHPALLQQVSQSYGLGSPVFNTLTNSRRIARMRVRISSTSASQLAFSASSPSTAATTCAPKFGGLE